MNRTDLQQLANTRLAEARALLAAGHASGAYYLAGYAVECALKAVIALQTQQYDFPGKQRAVESYTHDPRRLAETAGLTKDIEARIRVDRAFKESWTTVASWTEASGYSLFSPADALAIINAAGHLQEGVLPWITQYW